jgi:hypothetical protein
MPTPKTVAGQDPDLITHLFLTAPLPKLPRPRRLFQYVDVNEAKAECSHLQLVERYHTIAGAIEAGFGANSILSPSAWVRATSDLISRMLQGILATRNFGPDGEPLDHDQFKSLFNEDDWDAIERNLVNLDHISKIFPPPLQAGDPQLTCGHCLHRTEPESSDRVTWEDYQSTLMATDRSRASVIGHLKLHLLPAIDKDIGKWIDDETARYKNELRPRLQEDKQIHYTRQLERIIKEQDRLVVADSQGHYEKRLLELKREADIQLKREVAQYKATKKTSLLEQADPTAQPAATSNPPLASEGLPSPPTPQIPNSPHPSVPPTSPPQTGHPQPTPATDPLGMIQAMLGKVLSRLDALEEGRIPQHRQQAPNPVPHMSPGHQTTSPPNNRVDKVRPPQHKPAKAPTNPGNPPPRGEPAASKPQTATKLQEEWRKVSHKSKGKKSQPPANPASLRTDVTVQTAEGSVTQPRRDPSEITRQVCADLKAAKSPLILLSGRWASYTNNFVFTFAGEVPFQDVLQVARQVTQPFPGARLVPATGWSRVTFNGVPTRDPESGSIYSSDRLLEEVKRNPLCSDLHFVLPPRWVRPAERINGPHSTFSFAFLDPEGDISLTMAHTHLAMFGKAITFKKWRPRPPLMQCMRCHGFGHLPPRCQLPKDAVRCHVCGGNHRAQEHGGKCKNAANHTHPDTCDCPTKCINCGQEGHTARDTVCPDRAPFKTPAQDIVESTPPP